MSRYFEPISIGHLKAKLLDQCGEDDGDERYIDAHKIIEVVGNDIKVDFSLENTSGLNESEKSDFVGFQKLANGLAYLGITGGGDWEHPVFFCVYWDGKKIRAYIPTEGNPWNSLTKQAYGNDDEKDLKDAKKRWPDRFKECEEVNGDDFRFYKDQIRRDIEMRILPK